MKFLVPAIALAFLLSACVADSCDITGKWKSSGSASQDLLSREGSVEYDFNSDMSYTTDTSASADDGYESCGYSFSSEGTYTYDDTDDLLVLTPSSCEYDSCSGECDYICDLECGYDLFPLNITVVWASGCSSWHFLSEPEVVYEPVGPNWLLWVVLGAVVIGATTVVVVAVVVGVVLWKKKQASSNAYIYEDS